MAEFQNGQTAGGVLFILFLLLVVTWFAKKNNFFRLPARSSTVPVTFLQAIGGFLVYIVFAVVLLPIAVIAFSSITFSKVERSLRSIPPEWVGWIQLIALFIICLLLIGYLFCLKKETRNYVLWGGEENTKGRFIKAAGMGIVGLVVSYPYVLATGALARLISLSIWGKADVEQVAVKQLKMTFGHPALFALMVFAIVILVPFTEELLFRGFLQNFLKRHMKRGWAILITAVIFAFAHFSFSQGIGNFRLIFTLSVLSIFLGFIYERQKNLFAPVVMHATFNAASIFLIILGLSD